MHPTLQPVDRPHAIFLDAAGSLFRLREPVGQTYSRLAATFGVHAEPEKLEAAFRRAWRNLPPPLHPENQPPADDDQSWWRELVRQTFVEATGQTSADREDEWLFQELYSHYGQASAWQLYDETVAALGKLSVHYRLIVLSNFDRRLPGILRGLGIDSFFERVIISSEVGASKPHRRMFDVAIAASGMKPGQCLHVGDDPGTDIAGALAAGIACFHLDRPKVTLLTLLEKLASDDFPACIRRIPD